MNPHVLADTRPGLGEFLGGPRRELPTGSLPPSVRPQPTVFVTGDRYPIARVSSPNLARLKGPPTDDDLVRRGTASPRKGAAEIQVLERDLSGNHRGKHTQNPLRLRRQLACSGNGWHLEADPDLLERFLLSGDHKNLYENADAETARDDPTHFDARRLTGLSNEGRRLFADLDHKGTRVLGGHLEIEIVLLVGHERAGFVTCLQHFVCVVTAARLMPSNAEEPHHIAVLVVPCETSMATVVKVVRGRGGHRQVGPLLTLGILLSAFDEHPHDVMGVLVVGRGSTGVVLDRQTKVLERASSEPKLHSPNITRKPRWTV